MSLLWRSGHVIRIKMADILLAERKSRLLVLVDKFVKSLVRYILQ